VPSKRKIQGGTVTQTTTAIWISDLLTALEAEPHFWQGTLNIEEEMDVLESYNTVRGEPLVVPSERAYVITSIGRVAASYVRTAGI
jgi:hypothetical protein